MKRERWYLLMAIVVSMALKIASADAADGARPAAFNNDSARISHAVDPVTGNAGRLWADSKK